MSSRKASSKSAPCKHRTTHYSLARPTGRTGARANSGAQDGRTESVVDMSDINVVWTSHFLDTSGPS